MSVLTDLTLVGLLGLASSLSSFIEKARKDDQYAALPRADALKIIRAMPLVLTLATGLPFAIFWLSLSTILTFVNTDGNVAKDADFAGALTIVFAITRTSQLVVDVAAALMAHYNHWGQIVQAVEVGAIFYTPVEYQLIRKKREFFTSCSADIVCACIYMFKSSSMPIESPPMILLPLSQQFNDCTRSNFVFLTRHDPIYRSIGVLRRQGFVFVRQHFSGNLSFRIQSSVCHTVVSIAGTYVAVWGFAFFMSLLQQCAITILFIMVEGVVLWPASLMIAMCVTATSQGCDLARVKQQVEQVLAKIVK
jgi:hypothetical protein